ncbi:MAG: RDD family protein [Actinoplanes sp.]
MTQASDDAAAAAGPPLSGPPPAHPPYYGPPPQWRPQPVPLTPGGRPLADFGTRLLAYLIDSALLSAIAMVVFVPVVVIVMFRVMPDFASSSDPYETQSQINAAMGDAFVTFLLLELGFVVALLIAYYFYYVEMMYRRGQTLGKKLMKLQVIPLDPAATLTRGMAAKRYLVEFVGGTTVPFLFYLDGLWQLWDKPYQQTLHDKFAKTVVIKVAP